VASTPLAQSAVNAGELPKPDLPPATAQSGLPASTVISQPAESATVAAAAPVQLAQMINRVGQTEMRIEMNTAAFGSVQVRTVLHANDVGLVIGSEKGDLRTLLANDLPALTNTLQQQNLRLNSVNFMQGFAFSNNASGGGDSQARSFVPMRPPQNFASSESTTGDSTENLSPANIGAGQSGLSILA
jgi:flagellar hook-length control protein FliK